MDIGRNDTSAHLVEMRGKRAQPGGQEVERNGMAGGDLHPFAGNALLGSDDRARVEELFEDVLGRFAKELSRWRQCRRKAASVGVRLNS